MSRKYNFCSGPATLPVEVLEQAREELLDWQGKGMSVMEMSHRSAEFVSIAEEAERDFRELLAVPANYKVLFLQGGATAQFSMVPLNLLRGKSKADYVDTGIWSRKAIEEARRYCTVNVAATAKPQNYSRIPDQVEWQLDPEAAYVHYTPNETIGGVEFQWVPETGEVPLVADMSSDILSRPLDVSKFGCIYAGAQKNIGPAGLTIVVVREDLLGQALPFTPLSFDYKVAADNGSMYNTPPTYAWYLAGLVFKWLKRQGGVEAMAEINRRKADKLYQLIDNSGFYNNPIDPSSRSWMNIPFTLKDEALNEKFLAEAEAAGLANLQGHRSVGGMRASIYNAMPEAGVDALIEFMKQFEKQNG